MRSRKSEGRVTTRVFLVRHGSTVLSVEDRFAGRTNAALSDQGREQAQSLAKRLAKESLSAFYASPLDRTMETASMLANPHQKPVQSDPAFREIDHGVWEGLTRHEAETKFGEMYARWEADPFNYAPDGGESGLSVTARAMPALLSLVEKHAGETICVISHKATIRLLLSAVLGYIFGGTTLHIWFVGHILCLCLCAGMLGTPRGVSYPCPCGLPQWSFAFGILSSIAGGP